MNFQNVASQVNWVFQYPQLCLQQSQGPSPTQVKRSGPQWSVGGCSRCKDTLVQSEAHAEAKPRTFLNHPIHRPLLHLLLLQVFHCLLMIYWPLSCQSTMRQPFHLQQSYILLQCHRLFLLKRI